MAKRPDPRQMILKQLSWKSPTVSSPVSDNDAASHKNDEDPERDKHTVEVRGIACARIATSDVEDTKYTMLKDDEESEQQYTDDFEEYEDEEDDEEGAGDEYGSEEGFHAEDVCDVSQCDLSRSSDSADSDNSESVLAWEMSQGFHESDLITVDTNTNYSNRSPTKTKTPSANPSDDNYDNNTKEKTEESSAAETHPLQEQPAFTNITNHEIFNCRMEENNVSTVGEFVVTDRGLIALALSLVAILR